MIVRFPLFARTYGIIINKKSILPVTVETYVAYETFFPVSIIRCVDQFTPRWLFQMHTWAFTAIGKVAQYSDVISASWGLRSTTVRLFVQPFGQADIKDNI